MSSKNFGFQEGRNPEFEYETELETEVKREIDSSSRKNISAEDLVGALTLDYGRPEILDTADELADDSFSEVDSYLRNGQTMYKMEGANPV